MADIEQKKTNARMSETSDAESTQRHDHSENADLELEKANASMGDAESTQHDAESTQHDAESTQHDAESTPHDAESTQHDAQSSNRDEESTERDTESTQRDAESTQREAESTERDEHPVNVDDSELKTANASVGDSEAAEGQPEPVKKEFNLETADANEVMDEIIRVTQVNYEYMKQRVANPGPVGPNGESMAAEILRKYEEKDALLDLYFDRLKTLLQEVTPGLTELQIQQRQLAATRKLNNGMILF